MNNAEYLSKQGIKLSSFYMYETTNHTYTIRNSDPNKQFGTVSADTPYSAVHEFMEWLDKRHAENILTAEEKAYLSILVKPFRNKVIDIIKGNESISEEFLYFYMNDGAEFFLPNFPAGTMYKGMKNGKTYSLKELGL